MAGYVRDVTNTGAYLLHVMSGLLLQFLRNLKLRSEKVLDLGHIG